MKILLNILVVFIVLSVVFPQSAIASCCSSESTSHAIDTNDYQKSHDDAPCGNSTCECVCCGSISLVSMKKEIIEPEAPQGFHPVVFDYQSLHGSSFSSSIWQPPRLG